MTELPPLVVAKDQSVQTLNLVVTTRRFLSAGTTLSNVLDPAPPVGTSVAKPCHVLMMYLKNPNAMIPK